MQTQEIHAEVVAVWRVHDGVDVKFLRLGIVEHDAVLVIELDHNHWALDAIIEWALIAKSAGPAEMRLREMPFDVAHAGRKRPWRQRREIAPGKIEKRLTLPRIKLGSPNPLVGNDRIVLLTRGEHQAVDALVPSRRKAIRKEAVREDGLCLLLRRQVAGKFQAQALLVLECH